MLFGYFTLFVALTISAVAAYYSIAGLTAIFAAAVIPIIIMGAALELGKVTAAVWLKLNWSRAKWTYKLYLVPAVAFLMILTSIGCFGFLSKAHSDQSLISGDVQSKIAIYDEKIKTAKENIESNRKQLKQMDEAVDQVMARSTSEQGADKANAIRRSQQKDRVALAKDIEANQKLIATLNDEVAPIRAEVRKVEAEVGPIKYVAALIYGDNPDSNLLERAVRWVIILIVAVFDPLALVLILAAQQSIKWEVQKRADEENTYKPDAWVADVGDPPTAKEPQADEEPLVEPLKEQYPYLFKPWVSFPSNQPPMVYKPEKKSKTVKKNKKKNKQILSVTDVEPKMAETDALVEDIKVKQLEGDYYEVNDKKYSGDVFRYMYPALAKKLSTKIEPDNVKNTVKIRSSFGTKFPDNSQKGDIFLRVDYYPNRLFKFNGDKWIEVDKTINDSYTYDEQYIQYLIEKLASGEYEIDQLSATEQDLVAEKLQKNNDKA